MTDLDAITKRAKATGFLKADDTAISLAEFKKTCSVHNYGRGKKRIYFGSPNEGGMLSLFPDRSNKVEAIQECYDMLIDIIINKQKLYLDPYYIRIRDKYSISYGR